MSKQRSELIRELKQIQSDLEQAYEELEVEKINNLDDVSLRVTLLSEEMQKSTSEGSKEENEEAKQTLIEIRQCLTKLTKAMTAYRQELEDQLHQVNNKQKAFQSYVDSMHMEP